MDWVRILVYITGTVDQEIPLPFFSLLATVPLEHPVILQAAILYAPLCVQFWANR